MSQFVNRGTCRQPTTPLPRNRRGRTGPHRSRLSRRGLRRMIESARRDLKDAGTSVVPDRAQSLGRILARDVDAAAAPG